MQLYGKTGYLGEYELGGIVSEQIANGRKEYLGSLAVKHVGLCTRDGPKETTAQIRLTGTSTRAIATLVFEGSTARRKGGSGNRGRPVTGEGSGLNVATGGGTDGCRTGSYDC